MNFSMFLILFGVSAQTLEAQNLLRRLQGDLFCQSGQVYDYPYNNGNIKICQNGQTVLNYVGTAAQCHCPEETWNDNYSGRCITSCGGDDDESTHSDDNNNNLCQSNSGQIYGVPYNNGHVKICLNGETVWNFIGTDEQCHCPEGKWNDNYKGNCIDYCHPPVPSESSNLCQSGSGQIYDVPYNNGYINICQNGQTVLNYVGTDAQCHCPQGTWNDNYNGQCIHTCQSDHIANGESDDNNNNNLCQIGSGQVFGIPPNNGQVAVCLNGEIIFNFVGTNEQCHCPDETFNDNFTGQCIDECNPLHDDNNNNNNNLCQIGSGQIYGVPYNNGNVKICQNGHTVYNFVGLTEQCHCPENTWNNNYTGQCVNSCH